jgi:hypothetical protein
MEGTSKAEAEQSPSPRKTHSRRHSSANRERQGCITPYLLHNVTMRINPRPSRLAFSLCAIACLAMAAWSEAEEASPQPRDSPSGFLQKDGPVLMLEGRPLFEISFNKFDLFWQMLAAEFGRDNSGRDPEGAAARSLATLQDFGFKTIRIFLYDHGSLELFRGTQTKDRFFAAMDRMMDLCEKHDVRVVACLGLGDEVFAREAGEPWTSLIADKNSEARKLAEEYARAVVERYRDSPAIAMWEIQNELLLAADIGGRERVWSNKAIPTLTEVARFHREMSDFIKSIDPHHLTTTGDSYRTSLWHQNQFVEHGADHNMWQTDTWEQVSSAVAKAQAGVDVFHIHDYFKGSEGRHTVEPDGSRKPITFAAWREVAAKQNQPLYIGEWGALPKPRNEENADFWKKNPDWFTSFHDDREKAYAIVSRLLDETVAARVPLTHWWAFESERGMDKVSHRMDFTMELTPDFVRLVAEANRRLQLETMGFTYMKAP